MEKLESYIEKSVLCWLATADDKGTPNVSPKEIFTLYGDDVLLIANVASPQSEKNIQLNPQVCVSLIEIFEQRGYKLSGNACVVEQDDGHYQTYLARLRALADKRFPIRNIFAITITSLTPVVAPSYVLFPQTTVEQQVENGLNTYGVKRT
jgi:predicted pyridoxine 5'-phosphate oxidase superfamily flavin-nucleotide-binding protein